MKAPFGPGDIVEKFRLCPRANNVVPVGFKTFVLEMSNEETHDGSLFFRAHFNRIGRMACTCCFRLYEPPKPESIPTETKTPVKEKA